MGMLEILHLETSDVDAAAVEEQLRSAGIEAKITRVCEVEDFEQEIAREDLDIILASDGGRSCGGLRPLAHAREKAPEIPFILLSGSHEMANAIDALNAGATDYVIKQHISKLVPAVRRAVRESRQEAELLRARENLYAQTELLAGNGHMRHEQNGCRTPVNEAVTGDFIMRPSGRILTCNSAFLDIFGFGSTEEALSANFMSLLRSRKDGAELLVLLKRNKTIERHELEMRRSGGEAVYLVAKLLGVFDDRDELTRIQGCLFNDTKRKRLEQQLLQAQKLEGLGTLAGGIAHDFNNILAIILGYTGRLEEWISRPEVIPGAIHVIKEAVQRGTTLVQQLLTSAQQAEAHFTSVDLNALVRELEKMLCATFPKTVAFHLRLPSDFPLLVADRRQIHQVLLNLCVNARDAMPNGGTITIKTALASGAELSESFPGADARRYACISVRDTGLGMTPEVKAHIFEPFFTTKERAKGTGLGLSVVYGVVNNHRGFVDVETEQNVGTNFCIYLPVAEAPERFLARTPGAGAPQKRGEPQTILLVEDENMLRDLGVEILEGEGYRVLPAQDGVDAVELFTKHRHEIGLVICDLGLPRLGGREVHLRMKETKPGVRVIVASGYLEPGMRSEMLKAGVIDTIQKPYDFRELIQKIQGVIGKAHCEDDHPQLF